MDKMQRTAHTAPVSIGLGNNVGMEALLRELGRYQTKLDRAHRAIKHQRRKGHESAIKAETEKRLDVGAAVKSAMTDIMTDSEYGKVLYWKYVAKKLKACTEAGVLDASDAELGGLRKFMKGLKLT
ncbi:MAG: hypothetical protein JW753_05600 [Dehalococcoidia bacterium]|nr:hypothetical protein [Dehalococcoidia bacterium]